MKLENGKINSQQLSLSIVGFLIGSSIVLFPGGQAKQAAWIAIFMGMMEGIVFALIFVFLCRRFKDKTLIQIHDQVFGPYLGKLFSLLLLGYLFHLGALVISDFKDFLSITIMPRTPDVLFSVLITVVCVYAVYKGIEVIARCNQVLVSLVIGSLIMVFILLLKDINFENLKPIFDLPIKDLISAVQGVASFPFMETVAFGMVLPFLNNPQKGPNSVISGLLMGGVILVLAAIKNIGVLGASNGIFIYQNFQAERLINVGNLLTRMEILTVIAAVSTGFIKISVLLYGTALGGAQVLGLRSYRPLIIPIAILMIILSIINFKNVAENILFSQKIYPFYAFPFQVGIPLLTLIVAWIRGLPKN